MPQSRVLMRLWWGDHRGKSSFDTSQNHPVMDWWVHDWACVTTNRHTKEISFAGIWQAAETDSPKGWEPSRMDPCIQKPIGSFIRGEGPSPSSPSSCWHDSAKRWSKATLGLQVRRQRVRKQMSLTASTRALLFNPVSRVLSQHHKHQIIPS